MSMAIDFHLFWVMPSQSCVSARSVIWRLASSNRTNVDPTIQIFQQLCTSSILKTNKWLLRSEKCCRKEGAPFLERCLQNSWTANFDRSPLYRWNSHWNNLASLSRFQKIFKNQHHRCVGLDLCMIHQAHSQYYAATKNDQIHLTWSASEFQIVTRHASGNLQCLHFPLLIHAPCNNAFQMQTNGNIISNHVQ